MLIPGFTAGAQAPAELHTRWSPWRALLGALAPHPRAGVDAAADARSELEAQVAALHRVQAVIEFALDGTILQANDNFLQAMGYRLEEIQGRHHSLFVDPEHARSAEYRDFWARLGRGEYDAGQYRRFGKGQREIWIQASYNPVLDRQGRPYKVVKFATDITAQKLQAADSAGQLAAIDKSQAVIEFSMDGHILSANDNFLAATGYRLDEVRGQHHALFIEPDHRDSAEYRQFWEKLGRGEYDAGQYRRLGKGGREVWIQASYNPILDLNGKPFKVVKYATDITAQVHENQAMQRAVAQTREVVAAAKQGDLTRRVATADKNGPIAELCEGVNALVEAMGAIIGQIKFAADTIAVGATEIAQGNGDLSQRTEQQAASLEETAVSMKGLAETVQRTATNARQASQLAGGAADVAARGGSVVHEVVETMAVINASSRRIVDIIGVIDGIAFQTNILALNAAVEAARAPVLRAPNSCVGQILGGLYAVHFRDGDRTRRIWPARKLHGSDLPQNVVGNCLMLQAVSADKDDAIKGPCELGPMGGGDMVASGAPNRHGQGFLFWGGDRHSHDEELSSTGHQRVARAGWCPW